MSDYNQSSEVEAVAATHQGHQGNADPVDGAALDRIFSALEVIVDEVDRLATAARAGLPGAGSASSRQARWDLGVLGIESAMHDFTRTVCDFNEDMERDEPGKE